MAGRKRRNKVPAEHPRPRELPSMTFCLHLPDPAWLLIDHLSLSTSPLKELRSIVRTTIAKPCSIQIQSLTIRIVIFFYIYTLNQQCRPHSSALQLPGQLCALELRLLVLAWLVLLELALCAPKSRFLTLPVSMRFSDSYVWKSATA
jgi:hypothetical protein